MPTGIVRILEFDRITDMLADQCQFSVAIERAHQLGPASNSSTVRYLLDVTDHAIALLEARPSFSVGGARDIEAHVERAAIGSTLGALDLLEVLDTVSAARRVRRSFYSIEDYRERFPTIAEFIGFVVDLPGLEADLERSLGEHGDILDGASEKLGRLRRELRAAQTRAAERIRRYAQSPDYSSTLQDPIVTTRDGRYVVPVRSDRRADLPGMVHDTSASGQTLFVEPAEMVDLNNKVRELESAEQHEINRILAALTTAVAAVEDELLSTLEGLAALDLALAKARLAYAMRATRPAIVDESSEFGRRIALSHARHPLLPNDDVVPIDLVLGNDFQVLVITGPNTGGKTVALKTIGLLAFMTQSGLFIPADQGAEMPVFDGVFADIGDEQSIEQSLSTFSSHMMRVIAALEAVTPFSLVLFDELGAGTDPEEGSALARAIISRLLATTCLALTTTHYSDLKTYAYSTQGVENASVEFDLETLSPTYRLSVGIPGRSNALAIAGRLGMSEELLDQARTFLDPQAEHADVLISEIRAQRARAEEALQQAEQLESEAQARLAEAEERRSAAEREALADIELELAQARDRIQHLRRLPEQVPREQIQDTRSEARQELAQATQQVRKTARRRQSNPPKKVTLGVGDRVELLRLGGEGEVVGFSEDRTAADLQMGAFKLRQPIADLKKIGKAATGKSAYQEPRSATLPPSRKVDMELHLRGQRVAGIEAIVDDYLDDAYLSHLPFVRIVHGKGTGALREAVRDVLRRHPLVTKFITPPEQEGGDGVTLAYLQES